MLVVPPTTHVAYHNDTWNMVMLSLLYPLLIFFVMASASYVIQQNDGNNISYREASNTTDGQTDIHTCVYSNI